MKTKFIAVLAVLILALTMFSCDKFIPKNEKTVDFIVNGEVYATVKTEKGQTIEFPEDPVVDGYEFAGWYIDETCKTQFKETMSIVTSMSVYAKFDIDPYSDYTKMSVLSAREATVGDKIKIEGVVAKITYAFGMVPSGFYVVDGTNSIYVYGKESAATVAVGNKVTVCGTKAYWILEDEQNSAQKHGYKGCCQLENIEVVKNDGGSNAYDKSWITETTVKEIIDTPFTENITTTIFKVNAYVKKVVGTGFTNYYINDIDGETGSYSYSQCDGEDYAWLDEFDGKICTVYLSVINAKSSAGGCQYRFAPIEVIDENYTFDLSKAPEYAVKYLALDQFRPSYTGNPETVLITSASAEHLGFTNVEISYTSDNTAVIDFVREAGVTTLNCVGVGKATVTITAKHNGNEYKKTLEIEVLSNAAYDYISVSDAIDTQVGEDVIIKGIVGPSLVNKVGFYLFDDNGVIAVLADNETMSELEIGHEVIISGTRHNNHNPENTNFGVTYFGQTCIKNATLLANYYGNHEYNDANFVRDVDVQEFYALDAKVDYSTTVFVIEGNVTFYTAGYSTGVSIYDDNGKYFSLYCSGSGQYSWLKEFEGQKVTLEVIACNWNDKTYYRGCVISVVTEQGRVYNTLNFDVN